MLKILSRITEPTSGYAEIHGRLGSLLEVGTGFKADLTGRENVYLNGAILGMKRSEIRRRFDEIVEFSEIERFIDTPVKYYSSGMYMRLAFSVAVHLEPDILITDEVLSVGDVSFQSKCLAKMGDVAQSGRAVLFVSHNMLTVEDLCHRAIWLKDGRIADDGQPSAVISNYLQGSLSTDTERVWKEQTTAPGTDEVRLHRACVRPVNGSPADPLTVRTPFVMVFEYRSLRPNAYLALAVELYNEQGIVIFSSSPTFDPAGYVAGGLYRHICRVPGDLLNDGIHRVMFHIADSDDRTVLKQDDILVFDVQDSIEMRDGWYGKWPGAVRPMLDWSTELIGVEP